MTYRYTPDKSRLERIKTWMQAYVDEQKYPGSSLLITQGGQEVFFHATGLRDIARDLPFQRDTIVRLYSMTKPVTSVAVMMLLEKGLFHLEAPLSEFLPAFKDMHALIPGASRIDQCEACSTPTLHQLMTHTAGFSYPFNPGLLPREMDRLQLEFRPDRGVLGDMCDRLAELPLAFHPGARWEYSASIDLLGRVVEVVSGKTLAQFFADEIFAPLGMTQTGFSVPKGGVGRFASLYTPLKGDALKLDVVQPGHDPLRMLDEAGSSPFEAATLFAGGSGLLGTIDDYMNFCEMMRRGGFCDNERLLSAATVDFMRLNHLDGDIASMGPQSFAEQPMRGTGFALGGSVVVNPALTGRPGNIGEFGWGGIASTSFWLDPVFDLNGVFLTQLAPSSSYPARAELRALVHACMT